MQRGAAIPRQKVLHVFAIFNAAEFFDGQFAYLADKGNFDLHLAASPDCRIEEFCRRNKTIYHPITIHRTLRPWADLKALWLLLKLIRREHFDMVVGHTPKGALVSMVAAALSFTPKRIYYRHGLIYTTCKGLKRFVLKTEERFVSLLATKIVNVSPSLASLAIKERLNNRQKQLLIGAGTCGGIDAINLFNPERLNHERLNELRTSLGIKANELIIGFCGRLCNDKGIKELLEGFSLFKRRHPKAPCKLLLVGGYDSRDRLPEKIKLEIETGSDILSVGQIYQEVQYYYALMGLFVFPSYREGFGMSVLEASAMKLPILVTRSHGCVDSIIENETGLYINLSPEGICSGIERMADPLLRQHLGANGRTMVLQKYDHRIMWPQVLDLYKKL